MRRRGGFDKGIIFLVVIVLIVVGTGLFLYAQVRTDKVAELIKKGEPFTIAIFVTDRTHRVPWRTVSQTAAGGEATAVAGNGSVQSSPAGGAGAAAGQPTAPQSVAGVRRAPRTAAGAESSTLLFTELLTVDPKTGRGALLDIPGNVGSLISSLQKIEPIDVLFKSGKVDPFLSKLESLVGTSIPLYIETDITEIPKIVDLLGGLHLFIANPVEQTSTSPMILLPSGNVNLDGSKVESYLSYRGPSDSSVEIVTRRQRFVQALLKGLGDQAPLFEKSGVYSLIKSWVTTDMNRRSLLSFISLLAKVDTQRLIFQRVLGAERTVDNQPLVFPHYNGRLLRETMQQTLATLASPKALADQALTARLQILNGTLVNGLAHRTSQIFESFGYDVVSVGNADRQDYAHTLIVDRSGDMLQAQKVASLIRCTRVESQPAPPPASAAGASGAAPPYDVTVILGKDFNGRYCGK